MTSLPNLDRRGLMLILSSPSGAGKTTLSRRLLASRGADGSLTMSVSVTTRAMRDGETDGKDYFFVDKAKFADLVVGHQLLEYAHVFEHDYGTPAAFVEEKLDAGIDVLFDIDWQGTRQLKQKRPQDVVSIFILPPSLAELERRLRARAQDSEEVVARRMAKASAEISHWEEYDYVLVNDDLDITLGRIELMLMSERLKRIRQPWLGDFVAQKLT